MVHIKNPTFKFKSYWSWPKDVEDFVQSHIEGYSLHVCNGLSNLGDIRTDKFTPCDVTADFQKLPFRDALFDTVICDPPWNLPYHLRPRLHYALRDATKPGGKIIFNALHRLIGKGIYLEQVEVGVPNNIWRNFSVIQIYRRHPQLCETGVSRHGVEENG